MPWAHLDIAGMVWSEKARPTVPKGGTGFGVRLLTRLIENGVRCRGRCGLLSSDPKPLDDALPPLLAKTLAAEKRAFVCCSKEKFGPLSTAIWSRQPDSWLPHGITGNVTAAAESCPIWLSDRADDNGNKADFLFFLDGQAPDDLPPAERIFIIFDGTDEDVVRAGQNPVAAF